MSYPLWSYFPRNERPPVWCHELVEATKSVRSRIESTADLGVGADRTSDTILAHLRPGFEDLGYAVETGKAAHQKITRPVLYGDNGVPAVSYDIDAFHDGLGIAVEVEAGRGAANSADYRDLLRTSLLLDASYLALFMPVEYRAGKSTIHAYNNTRKQLEALYASRRLVLPFDGVFLIGY